MFVIGSVFFLPKYSDLEPVGSWIFFVASIFYLIVAFHDALELTHKNRENMSLGQLFLNIDFAAALNYMFGSILFMVGSVLFLPDVALFAAGAWCFIIGSFNFTAGAILNGLQIFEATTKQDAQYLLLTAMSYIIGSVAFLIPSIPYLFSFETESDEEKIDTFLAAIYIAGSVCFTVGGCINFYRSEALVDLEEEMGFSKGEEKSEEEEEIPSFLSEK